MKLNINNVEYTIQEVIMFFIIGYDRYKNQYSKNIENNKKNQFKYIIKSILETSKSKLEEQELLIINKNVFEKELFDWKFIDDDILSYATCVFYVLLNRENIITNEMIIKEFLSEIKKHHPRTTRKEANVILERIFKL